MRTITRGATRVLCAATLLAVAACGGNDRQETAAGDVVPGAATGAVNADRADDAVEAALRADTALAAYRLDADDERGRIVLEGTVATEAQKAHAATVAAGAAAGLAIDNQLQVSASAARRTAADAADDAEDPVEDAFDAEATLREFDLDADDEDGRLVLKGEVRSAAQRTLAEDVARRAAPNVRIDNQIRVRQ